MTVNDFKKLVSDQTVNLNNLCNEWNILSNENENIPENVIGDINASIGKAQLLIRERFKQFMKLIEDCENKSSEKEIRLDDLQGFWDMIYFQVDDVIHAFNDLEKIKNNDWKESVKEIRETNLQKPKPKNRIKKPLINYCKVKSNFRRPKTQLKPLNK